MLWLVNSSCESCGNGSGGVPGIGCNPEGASDSLIEFTAKCTVAMGGVDVPQFNCDKGTLVPENNLTGPGYPNDFCDAPNVLHGFCDPHSRFQVLKQTDEVAIVAHCRKQDRDDGFYGDIAVIQYNRISGATCFYQALGNLPAEVPPPALGNGPGQFEWQDPSVTAGQNCVGCHDSGPFIRSPYLAQLRNEPTNRLPGTNEGPGPWDQRMTWNKTLPYRFVGSDFQSWRVYSVSVTGTGNVCLSCHRLGVSSVNGVYQTSLGTAQVFGPEATAKEQSHKNTHTDHLGASPIWMMPGQDGYLPDVENQALAVKACAEAVVLNGNDGVPLPPGCSATQYGQGDTCVAGLITPGNDTGPAYAQIFNGPAKDLRLRVFPSNGEERAGAYAFNIRLK